MRSDIRRFSLLVMLYLFGVTAYSSTTSAVEPQRDKVRDTKREETTARERAARNGISEEKIQQAQKAFEHGIPSKLKKGSAAKAPNHSVGGFDPKGSASTKNTRGKIDFKNSPTAKSADKKHDPLGISSISADHSTSQEESRKPPSEVLPKIRTGL